MRQATRAQWIKCAIAILLYLVFLIWVRSWWGLIVIPFIFDIYITKKIPWSFWKRSKNPAVRSVMSWVCYYLCIGSRLLCQYLYLPKLPDSFFFSREIIAGRRLSICQQNELRSPRAEHTAFYAAGATYITNCRY